MKNITIILNDLYQADPSLKKHEPELIELINNLLRIRPDVKLDEKFRQELKRELLQRAGELKKRRGIIFLRQYLKPASFVTVVALLVAVILVPSGKVDLDKSFTFKETQKEERFFGSLVLSNEMGDIASVSAPEVAVSSKMAIQYSAPVLREVVTGGAGGMIEPIMVMPPYIRTNYSFSYNGNIDIKETKMNVLQRNKETIPFSFLSKIKSEALDFSLFKNAQLQNFSFKDDDLLVNVNLTEGNISMSRVGRYVLERGDEVYSDITEVTEIAKNFAKTYNINLDNFREPVVQKNEYDTRFRTVIFPLEINGRKVYERSGILYGLSMTIDGKEMKVTNLWNLSTQRYDSSLYEISTSGILDYLKKGAGRYNTPNASETINVDLETPEIVYMRFSKYEDQQINEFLVPALLFGIKDIPENFYQENIIVPLIKEMLDDIVHPVLLDNLQIE